MQEITHSRRSSGEESWSPSGFGNFGFLGAQGLGFCKGFRLWQTSALSLCVLSIRLPLVVMIGLRALALRVEGGRLSPGR